MKKLINFAFKSMDNTLLSKIIVYIFDKTVFINDIPIYQYNYVLWKNVLSVCQSRINTAIYKYIHIIFIYIPLTIINVLLILKTYLYSFIPLTIIYELLICILIIYCVIKFSLEYIAYFHYNKYLPIENKFMLDIHYVPYKEGKKYPQSYEKAVKFFCKPDDYFEFYELNKIFIGWDGKIQDHAILSKEFYDNVYIENEKDICDFEKIPYIGKEITIFDIYGYHNFRYVASKKLLLQFQFSTHKKSNILIIFLAMIFFVLQLISW